MNLQENKNQGKKWLRKDVVPVLVLLQYWKRSKLKLACETNVIFVILQAIQRICIAEKKTLTEIIDDVKEQCGEVVAAEYVTKVKEVGSSLFTFVNLVDDVMKLLATNDGMVDVDVKGSIFGLFIGRCHMEFSKLTFTQTKRIFLEYKNYVNESLDDSSSSQPRQPLEKISVQMKALEKHLQSRDYHKMLNLLHNDTNSNNISSWLLCRIAGVTDVKSPLFAVGMATLLLSAIQRQFGYHTESTNSLREAIMLAQEEQFYKILDYAMLWLQQFHENESNNLTALLKHLSHHLHNEKLHDLQWWGNLRLANQKLSTCSTPLSSITTLQSQLRDLMAGDYKVVDTSTVISTTCAIQTVAWQQYGFSTVSVLYAQLQAHMMSHEMASVRGCLDILGLRGQQALDNLTQSLCCCALQLFSQAQEDDALRLLAVGSDHITAHGYTAKSIQQCRQELVIKRAVVRGRVQDAEKGAAGLNTLDSPEADYWMAVVYAMKGNMPGGFKLTNDLLEAVRRSKSTGTVHTVVDLEARLLLLLSRLLGDHLGQPGQAIAHIQECIALCNEHHLGVVYREALLYWAQLQLLVGSHEQCMSTVKDHMINIKANGSVLEQSIANFLLAQALYLVTDSRQQPKCHHEILPILDEAVSGFEQCQASSYLEQSLLLQAHLYGEIGSAREQERVALQIPKLR